MAGSRQSIVLWSPKCWHTSQTPENALETSPAHSLMFLTGLGMPIVISGNVSTFQQICSKSCPGRAPGGGTGDWDGTTDGLMHIPPTPRVQLSGVRARAGRAARPAVSFRPSPRIACGAGSSAAPPGGPPFLTPSSRGREGAAKAGFGASTHKTS